jgi:D-lactate dehydrogenase (cytochrome)
VTTVSRVAAPERLAADLHALIGDRATTSSAVREHHSKGESYHTPVAPDLVVFPETTDEVSAIVRVCARHGAPVIPSKATSSRCMAA